MKQFSVPAGPVGRAVKRLGEVLFAFADRDGNIIELDGRDITKPVCYDSQGRPLYAPYRGPTFRWR